MAEPSKPKRPRSTRAKAAPKAEAEKVEDAVVVEDTVEASPTAAERAEKLEEAISNGAPDAVAPDDDPENAPVEAAPLTDESREEPQKVGPVAVAVAEPARGPGFFGLFLGGVVAAGLGAGALFLAQDRGWLSLGVDTSALEATVAGQTDRIEELQNALVKAQGEIETLQKDMPDGAALTAADVAAEKARGDLTETVTALRNRIESVEMQPIPKAELPAEVVAAYEARLAEMLATVDSRFSKMQEGLDGKLAEIAAAQAAANTSEQEAERAADLAAAQAALSRVEIAMQSGGGFADDLAVLSEKAGIDAPAALADLAETGAPTLAALKGGFPEAARKALTAATRAAASDGSVSPLSAFLRTQLGARSLEPREGDDADAVLSRAEAAVGMGDLDAALAEIAALPEVGREALADWVAQAETRRGALAAVADISAQLNN